MEQRTPDFIGIELFLKRTGAQFIGVARGYQLRLVAVGGHQAMFDERIQKGRAPPEIAVPPPPRRARVPAIDGERGARLRITAIGKDAYADIDDMPVAFNKSPAYAR